MSVTSNDVGVWEHLLSDACAELRTAAAAIDPTSAADISRLRRAWDQPLVHAAIELAVARRRAAVKYPDRPDIVADVKGIEQASSALIAAHKTRRFALIGATSVYDLCCGIGGDAMSLASSMSVTAVDAGPLRAWMTRKNAGCETTVADVRDLNMEGVDAFHIDPARRSERTGQRAWRYEHYQPDPTVIEELIVQCPHAAVKLGPGIDLDTLPLADREIEVVSERGQLTQAIMWCGQLAFSPGHRTATLLSGGETITGKPSAPPVMQRGRHLYEPDASLERTKLLGTLCESFQHALGELHPGLGLLTSDAAIDSPWLRRFEILHVGPWRERHVRDALRSHDCGEVVVKVRGVHENPDHLQTQWRGEGNTGLVVFITRFGVRRVAIITRPVGSGSAE